MRPAPVHHQQNEIGSLPADLESNAATLERHHRWRAPRTSVVLARTASHRAASVASADDKRSLQYRRVKDDAFGLVQQILRNIIGDIQNFLQHRPAIV